MPFVVDYYEEDVIEDEKKGNPKDISNLQLSHVGGRKKKKKDSISRQNFWLPGTDQTKKKTNWHRSCRESN